MKTITKTSTHLISGGNPVVQVAVGTGAALIGGAAVIDAYNTIDAFADKISDIIFDKFHPDPLGQMIFPKVQYAPEYVQYQHDYYAKISGHYSENNFHNSFGNF